jgi:hypothetical protein
MNTKLRPKLGSKLSTLLFAAPLLACLPTGATWRGYMARSNVSHGIRPANERVWQG